MEERLLKLERTVQRQRLVLAALTVLLGGAAVMGFDKDEKTYFERLEVGSLAVRSNKDRFESGAHAVYLTSDKNGNGLIELHSYDGVGGSVGIGIDLDGQAFVGTWNESGKHEWHGPPDSSLRLR